MGMWKSIPSTFDKYEASKNGEIRRIKEIVSFGKQKRLCGGSVLSPKTKKNGYLEVSLNINGNYKSKYVHRLVAEAWLGTIPHKMTVNHKDGVKSNNAVDNLEIISYSENSKHAYRLGLLRPLRRKGVDHPRSRANEDTIRKIRREHALHHSIVKLLQDYPQYSKGALTKIVYRQCWKHIK